MYSIEKMKKAARRRLRRLTQRSHDAGMVRRALAILRLAEAGSGALVAEQISAARSSVYRWQAAYREKGIKGLRCILVSFFFMDSYYFVGLWIWWVSGKIFHISTTFGFSKNIEA